MANHEFDQGLIKRLALMQEGNAKAHLNRALDQQKAGNLPREALTQHHMLAASGFAIAASYWSLIDPHHAVRVYRVAAATYREMRHEYWIVLALASGSEDDIAAISSVTNEISAPSPQTVAFAMVGNEMLADDPGNVRSKHLSAHWHHFGNLPIGRLGVRLDHYARCAQAMHAARVEKNSEHFFAEAADYVHRAAEVLRDASHDRFHWLRMESTILPAEPEAVAMTAAMSTMSHRMFGIPISKMPSDLDAHGRLLVEVGDELRDAAHGNDERRC